MQPLEDKHNVVIEGLTWLATILRWPLNDAQLVLRSQKCFKKIRPTPLHHQQAIEVIQDRMDPHFRGFFFTNF